MSSSSVQQQKRAASNSSREQQQQQRAAAAIAAAVVNPTYMHYPPVHPYVLPNVYPACNPFLHQRQPRRNISENSTKVTDKSIG